MTATRPINVSFLLWPRLVPEHHATVANLVRWTRTRPASAREWRVRNMPEFQKAFGCKKTKKTPPPKTTPEHKKPHTPTHKPKKNPKTPTTPPAPLVPENACRSGKHASTLIDRGTRP